MTTRTTTTSPLLPATATDRFQILQPPQDNDNGSAQQPRAQGATVGAMRGSPNRLQQQQQQQKHPRFAAHLELPVASSTKDRDDLRLLSMKMDRLQGRLMIMSATTTTGKESSQNDKNTNSTEHHETVDPRELNNDTATVVARPPPIENDFTARARQLENVAGTKPSMEGRAPAARKDKQDEDEQSHNHHDDSQKHVHFVVNDNHNVEPVMQHKPPPSPPPEPHVHFVNEEQELLVEEEEDEQQQQQQQQQQQLNSSYKRVPSPPPEPHVHFLNEEHELLVEEEVAQTVPPLPPSPKSPHHRRRSLSPPPEPHVRFVDDDDDDDDMDDDMDDELQPASLPEPPSLTNHHHSPRSRRPVSPPPPLPPSPPPELAQEEDEQPRVIVVRPDSPEHVHFVDDTVVIVVDEKQQKEETTATMTANLAVHENAAAGSMTGNHAPETAVSTKEISSSLLPNPPKEEAEEETADAPRRPALALADLVVMETTTSAAQRLTPSISTRRFAVLEPAGSKPPPASSRAVAVPQSSVRTPLVVWDGTSSGAKTGPEHDALLLAVDPLSSALVQVAVAPKPSHQVNDAVVAEPGAEPAILEQQDDDDGGADDSAKVENEVDAAVKAEKDASVKAEKEAGFEAEKEAPVKAEKEVDINLENETDAVMNVSSKETLVTDTVGAVMPDSGGCVLPDDETALISNKEAVAFLDDCDDLLASPEDDLYVASPEDDLDETTPPPPPPEQEEEIVFVADESMDEDAEALDQLKALKESMATTNLAASHSTASKSAPTPPPTPLLTTKITRAAEEVTCAGISFLDPPMGSSPPMLAPALPAVTRKVVVEEENDDDDECALLQHGSMDISAVVEGSQADDDDDEKETETVPEDGATTLGQPPTVEVNSAVVAVVSEALAESGTTTPAASTSEDTDVPQPKERETGVPESTQETDLSTNETEQTVHEQIAEPESTIARAIEVAVEEAATEAVQEAVLSSLDAASVANGKAIDPEIGKPVELETEQRLVAETMELNNEQDVAEQVASVLADTAKDSNESNSSECQKDVETSAAVAMSDADEESGAAAAAAEKESAVDETLPSKDTFTGVTLPHESADQLLQSAEKASTDTPELSKQDVLPSLATADTEKSKKIPDPSPVAERDHFPALPTASPAATAAPPIVKQERSGSSWSQVAAKMSTAPVRKAERAAPSIATRATTSSDKESTQVKTAPTKETPITKSLPTKPPETKPKREPAPKSKDPQLAPRAMTPKDPPKSRVKPSIPATTFTTDAPILILISSQSFDREVGVRQERAYTLLSSKNIKYATIDGADPANKDIRSELFAISGLRVVYPQFFKVRSDGTAKFWGDWDRFEQENDAGTLVKELSSFESIAPPPVSQVVASKAKENTPDTPQQPVKPAKPENAEKLPKSETSRLLILVSSQSMDRQTGSRQQNAFTLLDAKNIAYETLDGADPVNKEKRNDLFSLSGIRAKYPQFFKASSNGDISFWGDWDHFELCNESGTLARELGVSTASASTQKKPSSRKEVAKPAATKTSVANSMPETLAASAKTFVAPGGSKLKEKKDQRPVNASGEMKARPEVVPSVSKEIIIEQPSKASDITVYGATSFVAKHVLSYLRQISATLHREFRITLAGRNQTKLDSLKEECSGLMLGLSTVHPKSTGKCTYDIFVAESTDVKALKTMVERTHVVLSCAGPYAKYGSNLVAACAEIGVDYVDITGEISWAGQMRQMHGRTAAKSGARIISFCGFDSVPSDLAVFAAFRALKKSSTKFNKSLEIEKATTWHSCVGIAGGGTIHTALQMPVGLDKLFRRPVPFLLEDPLILVHPTLRADPKSDEARNRLAAAEWMNQLFRFDSIFCWGVSIPFFMAPVNAKVVHASAIALHYGENFKYRERFVPTGYRMTAKLGVIALIPALIVQLAVIAFVTIIKIPVLGKLLADAFAPPGTGMSDRMCKEAYAEVYAQVTTSAAKTGKVDKADVLIKFEGDPGNWVTAQCACESALALLLNKNELPPRSEDGFGTPAELLGTVLLKRLQKTAVRPVQFETQVRRNVDEWEWGIHAINLSSTR